MTGPEGTGHRTEPDGPEERPPPGRVLGLDLGDARIGVAISDDRRRMAVPLGTVRTGAPADLRAVAALVRDHDVAAIVVGHPLSLSGARGQRARHAEEFVEALRAFVGIPVELHDERLSTMEADRGLRDAGAGGRRRRQVVDQHAAAVILQWWLDSQLGS